MSNTTRLTGVKSERSGTLIVVLISAVLAIIGLVLVGLPGAVVLQAAMILTGLVSSARLGGDQVWPAALTVSAFGPFVLVAAHLVLRRTHLVLWLRALLSMVLSLAVTLVASVVGIVLLGQ